MENYKVLTHCISAEARVRKMKIRQLALADLMAKIAKEIVDFETQYCELRELMG